MNVDEQREVSAKQEKVHWRFTVAFLGAVSALVHKTIFYLLLMDAVLFLKVRGGSLDLLNNIVAPLIVAAFTGILGWLWGQRRSKRKIDAAPRRYVMELDRLIMTAVQEGEARAVINARAIVATRNNLRSSLVSISKSLNSEIDRLAQDVGESLPFVIPPSGPRQNDNNISARQAYETIQVLSKVWPSKKAEIEFEIRKLLAELGLGLSQLSSQ